MSKGNENQVIVTRRGYEHLTAELTNLRTVRRQEVARQLEEARAFGDLSENAEYAAAKDEQSKVEGRILELETMLARIKIVDEESLDTGKVAIGLTVTLFDLDHSGKEYVYTIVGSEELSSTSDPNPAFQRISQKSPVGQAILDHTVGDEVTVKIPHGFRHLKITAITRARTKTVEEEQSDSENVGVAEGESRRKKENEKKENLDLENVPAMTENADSKSDTDITGELGSNDSNDTEVNTADASVVTASEPAAAPKKRTRKVKAVEGEAADVDASVEDTPKKKRTRKPKVTAETVTESIEPEAK